MTQLISHQTKSERVIAINTAREIHRINQYEKSWKIKTNRGKLKIIPISRRKSADVLTPDEEYYEYGGEGKVLGLTLTSTGYVKHIKERIKRAKIELKKIKRFRNYESVRTVFSHSLESENLINPDPPKTDTYSHIRSHASHVHVDEGKQGHSERVSNATKVFNSLIVPKENEMKRV